MSEASAAPAAAPVNTSAAPAETGNTQEVSTGEGQSKKTPPAFKRFKVGDEEVALTEADVERDYKKWKAADSEFRKAAQMRKEAEEFKRALAENPDQVLAQLPIDKRKIAEKWLLESVEAELNPPDPRDQKLTEMERKLKEFEEKEANEKRSREEAEEKAAIEYRKAQLSQTLAQAMEATHLSKHPESAAAVLREMAVYMRAARERGEDVTPQELVEHIHNSRFHQMYTLAHSFEGEELLGFLGDEIVNRIRKADLARIRKSREQANQHKEAAWVPEDKKPSSRMDPLEAKRHAEKLLRR